MSTKLLVPLAALLGGCHITFGSSALRVDGVELPESHVETVEVGSFAAGFAVDSAVGDILVEPANGAPTLVVEVHEATPGDAFVTFVEGRLDGETRSGEPCALGDVTLRTDEPIARLTLASGAGDVRARGVRVQGEVSLRTGVGTCSLDDIDGATVVTVESGTGNVRAVGLECETLSVSSGTGGVRVERVVATEADLDTGIGDVDVKASRFRRLDASTGIGSVTCEDVEYEEGDLDAGIGSVRER